MKELEDERRLDERREACLNAIFAGFAMEKSSTTALKVGVSASRMESEQTPSALRRLVRMPKTLESDRVQPFYVGTKVY